MRVPGSLGGSFHFDEFPLGAIRPVRGDADRGEADALVHADCAPIQPGDGERELFRAAKRSRPRSRPASTKLFPRPLPVRSGCRPRPISSLGRAASCNGRSRSALRPRPRLRSNRRLAPVEASQGGARCRSRLATTTTWVSVVDPTLTAAGASDVCDHCLRADSTLKSDSMSSRDLGIRRV
jgi:hypothetical protein